MDLEKYMSRLQYVDTLIRRKATGTPKQLAKKLSLSESSIYLILRSMKSMGASIAFDHHRNSYVYMDDHELIIGFKKIRSF